MHTGLLTRYHITTVFGAAPADSVLVTQTMMKASRLGRFVGYGICAPLTNMYFWSALGELAVVAFILLHMLNICLISSPLALSTTLYQVGVIVFTITAGCAFYGDLTSTDVTEFVTFFMGVAFVISGLTFLMLKREVSQELVSTQEGRPTTSKVDTPPQTLPDADQAIQELSKEASDNQNRTDAPMKAVRVFNNVIDATIDPDPEL